MENSLDSPTFGGTAWDRKILGLKIRDKIQKEVKNLWGYNVTRWVNIRENHLREHEQLSGYTYILYLEVFSPKCTFFLVEKYIFTIFLMNFSRSK